MNNMNNIEIINGDICNSDTQYIAHQCNCVTNYGKGLSKTLFSKYPYSDIYICRTKYKDTNDIPGTIVVRGDGINNRFVINMLSQFYPGKARYYNDTIEKRREWFWECLYKISQIPNITSISFPHNIGCGLAGGNWNEYFTMIQCFSNYSGITVKIYKI